MTPGRIVGGLTAAGLALGLYATFVEPRWYALRTVSLRALRPGRAGTLRILHLSDLHLQPGEPRLRRFVEHCAAQEAEVVVVTGDILGHRDAVEFAVDLLAPLARASHALFVLGSNDRYGPTLRNPLRYLWRSERVQPHGEALDTAALVRGLTQTGWRQLDNRRLRLDTAVGPVEAYGIGDAHIRADRINEVDWTPAGADAALALGVTHAPYRHVLGRMDQAGIDLALAGHTHGGQLRLPGVGALVNNCDLPLRHSRGLSGYGAGLALHVSAGLGANRFTPFRLACRPEATLLEIVEA